MDIPLQLISTLRSAKHVVAFTGAGVSAESGIPTFRETMNGLWELFNPDQFATLAAFRENKDVVWGWYEYRRASMMRCEPNPAHLAIAAMAMQVPKLTVITQNIDDLHERAGSRDAIHLHGSINRARCLACARPHEFPPGLPGNPPGNQQQLKVEFSPKQPEEVLHEDITLFRQPDHRGTQASRGR